MSRGEEIGKLIVLMERAAAALLHAETEAEVADARALVLEARDFARQMTLEATP